MRRHGSGEKGDCRAEVVTVRQLVLRSRVNGVGGKSRRRSNARLGGERKESERISVRERTEVELGLFGGEGKKDKENDEKAKRRNGRLIRRRRRERQSERRPKTGTRTERDEPGWTVEGDGGDYERAYPYYYRATGAILPHRPQRGTPSLSSLCVTRYSRFT